eukprot:1333509-Rhodomonas_salina.2
MWGGRRLHRRCDLRARRSGAAALRETVPSHIRGRCRLLTALATKALPCTPACAWLLLHGSETLVLGGDRLAAASWRCWLSLALRMSKDSEQGGKTEARSQQSTVD